MLINASPGRTLELVKRLRNVPAIQDADVITGEYGIVAICEGQDLEPLGTLIVEGDATA